MILRAIQRYEATDGIPSSRGGALERVAAALEKQGVEFFGDPESSARQSPQPHPSPPLVRLPRIAAPLILARSCL